MIRSTPAKYSSYGAPRYWCTAIQPDCRPNAVDSGMSSPEDTRTSIGNRIGVGRVAANVRTARTASARCSTGRPYSISTKRTRRGLQNTLSLRSTRSRSPAADVTTLASRRHRAGEPATDAADEPEAEVLAEPLVAGVGEPRLWPQRLVGSDVALDLAPASTTGHPVQLEVVDRGRLLDEPVEQVVERLDGLAGVQPERRHALQGHLGDDPQCAEADPGDAEQVAVDTTYVAATIDQLHPDDSGRQVAEVETGAVGGGGDGAGDRLLVDVAKVGHRQRDRRQRLVQRVQPDPRLDADTAGRRVDLEHAGHAVEGDLDAIGRRRRGERVPGADRLDPPTGFVCPADDVGELVDRPRLGALGGDPALVAGPVGHGRRHGRRA